MMNLESPRLRPLSLRRRALAVVIGVLLVADIVAYAAALARPDLVVLRDHFANWLTGVGILCALLFVGAIVAFPLRNPPVQRVLARIRTALFILMVPAFMLTAWFHGVNTFTYVPRIVASSPDGTRHAALVSNGRWSELHVFTGDGLGQRDLGDVGAPCNLESITFTGNNSISVESTDGTVVISLNPGTGAPLNVLQRTCPFEVDGIGPVPSGGA